LGSRKLFCPSWLTMILPNISLPHSLGWQAHATIPSYWLWWGRMNSLPSWPQTTILLISDSQVCRITSVSHLLPVCKSTTGTWFVYFWDSVLLCISDCLKLAILLLQPCNCCDYSTTPGSKSQFLFQLLMLEL
jgi:hypothetical protein